MEILPLTNDPERLFSVTITNVVYNLRQLWNTLGFWTIDVSDEDNNMLISGVKLVTQTELTEQYPNIPFDLRSEADLDPSRNTLDSFNLVVTNKDA